MLMKSRCYTHLGYKDLAATSLQDLLNRFPNSEYVSKVKTLLKNM